MAGYLNNVGRVGSYESSIAIYRMGMVGVLKSLFNGGRK